MSIRDWQPGRVSLVEPPERAPNLRLKTDQDRRTADEYAADLAGETDRSLAKSPHWRVGLPLADHRERCDCPATLIGCTERRAWPTLGDIGGGRNLDSRQGRKLGPPDRGRQ